MARGQNILAKVFNKPQLITLEGFQPIVDYLADPQRSASLKLSKETEVIQLRSDFTSDSSYRDYELRRLNIDPVTMNGTLFIKDTLVNREGQLNANCMELTSYEGLKKTFKAQVEQGMKTCTLMFDSGGGEAYGCFESANAVRKMADEHGIKLTAYVDGTSASASYAWTVIADEIIANPMARVGSVGVVVQLYNNSKMLENIGIERSFVYAGGNKIPFDADGNFTENFINSLQDGVDKSYNQFVKHVANHLSLDEQIIRDTQASVYDADVALEKGLIHKIMEIDEFKEYMTTNSTENNNPITLNKDTSNMKTVEQLQQELDSQTKTLTDVQAQNTKLLADLKTATDSQAKLQAEYDALVKAKAEADADAIFASRKAKLENALGKDNDQIASLLSSTASLDEASFDVIASSFTTKQEATQKELEEKGGEGQESKTQLNLSDLITQRALAHKNKQAQ